MSFSKIGLIVVGDEILSGQRQDKHVAAVIERLQERGLVLSWVQIVGDDRTYLTEILRRSFASDHLVLSCGGIGATPDDHTRQAAAAALGRPLVRHPDAVALIRQRCAENQLEVNEFRLRMADFPLGAALIPNAYNKIPGFSVGQHYFVPGFPVMAWPMIELVLDQYYSHLHHQQRSVRCALRVYKTMEADLTPLMEVLEQSHPACTLYSLPCVGDESTPAHVELGVKVRGGVLEAEQAQSAFDVLQQELTRSGRLFDVLTTS